MTASPQPAHCLRCGRKLTAQASISRQYGRGCRARIRAAALAEAVRDFTADQVGKALELIADGGLVPTGRPGVYRAVSSKGDESYLCHSQACVCAGGRHHGRCYHRAGVRMIMARKAA